MEWETEERADQNTQLNTSTHLVMSLAEERRGERQTFELGATKSEKHRRQIRRPATNTGW